jgi:hypothetical protein
MTIFAYSGELASGWERLKKMKGAAQTALVGIDKNKFHDF